MCGIVGAIAAHDVVATLIDGLKRLEYRGYDSAGVAMLNHGKLHRVRRVGRVSEMERAASEEKLAGNLGIGHTRWATHGGVTEHNAHPHISGGIAVVHNGIIENHDQEREKLEALGYVFESQTDTEVIAHLVHYQYQQLGDLFQALQKAVTQLSGAYAIAVIALDQPEKLVCARMGCPLLVGIAEDGAHYVASDVSAIISATRKVIFLEEGDIAEMGCGSLRILNLQGEQVNRPVHISDVSLASLELGQYSHFMQKEIHEQPKALSDTIDQVIEDGISPLLFGEDAEQVFKEIEGLQILACGTSYYAAMVGKYWLEAIAGIHTDVEIASEYRYRPAVANPKYLVVTISQSGETLDTMEALKYAISLGHKATLSICNVRESALPRASKMAFYTRAGPEIGVASTKAFTTQLVALFTLALTLAKTRGRLTRKQELAYLDDLRHLPGSVQHALNLEPQIKLWAEKFVHKSHALFLGRGLHYPIALEGALKLKEISYIHAEAYAAGELKHGPLALVDSEMPVVVIAPNDALLEKLKSNMQEVRARNGELFVFADSDSHFGAAEGVHVIRTPRHVGALSPVVHAIPVQLLAYHTALMRGTDVDKPRNLAKSVTVE